MLGSTLGTVVVALFIVLIWSPWSTEDDSWVNQTSNRTEQTQEKPPVRKPSPKEKVIPQQPNQEFDKTNQQEEDDEPVMFAEETPSSPSTEPEAAVLNDVVVNNETPTEAERFSTLAADKDEMSENYVQLIDGARMIASDLDLRVESSTVKSFNSKHFDRLVKMLNQPEYQGKELFLVGVAGSVGSNFIAKNRADFAKEILEKKYQLPIAITTYGFGANTDEPARGQRLEAWVK
jgi:hypothetical protein